MQPITKATELLDKHADTRLKLATGALALSITFRSDLVSSTAGNLWALKTAWIGFTVAILCDVYASMAEAGIWLAQVQKLSDKRPIWWLKLLWGGASAGFATGIIMLLAFALWNVS